MCAIFLSASSKRLRDNPQIQKWGDRSQAHPASVASATVNNVYSLFIVLKKINSSIFVSFTAMRQDATTQKSETIYHHTSTDGRRSSDRRSVDRSLSQIQIVGRLPPPSDAKDTTSKANTASRRTIRPEVISSSSDADDSSTTISSEVLPSRRSRRSRQSFSNRSEIFQGPPSPAPKLYACEADLIDFN